MVDVSNLQRRQRRKSTLGTHRGYSIGFPLLTEPTSQTRKSDSPEKDLTDVFNFSNITFRSSRRNVLASHNSIKDSPSTVRAKTPLKIIEESSPKVEKNIPVKKLDTIFSSSFEEVETTMMANDEENSILATTLVDDTILEINKSTDKTLNKENIETDNNTSNKLSQETIEDLVKLFDSMIKENNKTVIGYNKQIDDIRKHIEDTNGQTEKIKSMKLRLLDNFSVSDESGCELLKAESEDKTQTKFVQDTQLNLETPTVSNASPSKQIIKEIRSTIKYLKTPRMSRVPRSSVLLTPHSMSFCIKSQCEQLLE